jgi:8-oxo-dGTP pyrophosphatase MutT (NUDIX family)
MTDDITAPRRSEGPARIPGARAVRPRNAATLFIVRRDGDKPRVLMGKRHGGHNFMPNLWVFPGGRIDRSDYRAPYATDLRPDVLAKFASHIKPGKARALGLAAIRETFEEAGLLLAKPGQARSAAGSWREFLAQGALPDLAALSVIFRAITPPMVGKRFDTWFLMADAEEIAWFEFEAALELPLPSVTRAVIKEVMARVDDPDRPAPFMRFTSGAAKVSHI